MAIRPLSQRSQAQIQPHLVMERGCLLLANLEAKESSSNFVPPERISSNHFTTHLIPIQMQPIHPHQQKHRHRHHRLLHRHLHQRQEWQMRVARTRRRHGMPRVPMERRSPLDLFVVSAKSKSTRPKPTANFFVNLTTNSTC